MPGRKRTALAIDAERRNAEQLSRLGREVREGRRAKRLTQAQLGDRVGLSRASVSRAELGYGDGLTLDAWQRIGLALDRPVVIRLQHDTTGETADAGHLALQELVLRLARSTGRRGRFELSTRPAEPSRSADVGIVDEALRCLVLVECWNVIGDVGAAVRASDRKLAEAQALAAARWGQRERVALVWVVRAIARNRALLARYPEVFASRFPGSSRAWAEALVAGRAPPNEPGIVWAGIDADRLFAVRLPGRVQSTR